MFTKTKFDISHENFDIFFANHLAAITPEAKEKLPRDVVYKLWQGGGGLNVNNSSKLNFIAKLWILWKCFRKKIWIVVEDENGISLEHFSKLSKSISRKRIDNESLENGVADGTFVTGIKELSDTLDYLNKQSASSLYNYLKKAKNANPNKVEEWNDAMDFIVDHLSNYERTKKKWITEYGLCMPEYYVLLSTYSGPVRGSDIYKKIYKGAYFSSATKIKVAFGNLQRKGLIVKDGVAKGATFRITALGSEMMNTIFSKYLLK